LEALIDGYSEAWEGLMGMAAREAALRRRINELSRMRSSSEYTGGLDQVVNLYAFRTMMSMAEWHAAQNELLAGYSMWTRCLQASMALHYAQRYVDAQGYWISDFLGSYFSFQLVTPTTWNPSKLPELIEAAGPQRAAEDPKKASLSAVSRYALAGKANGAKIGRREMEMFYRLLIPPPDKAVAGGQTTRAHSSKRPLKVIAMATRATSAPSAQKWPGRNPPSTPPTITDPSAAISDTGGSTYARGREIGEVDERKSERRKVQVFQTPQTGQTTLRRKPGARDDSKGEAIQYNQESLALARIQPFLRQGTVIVAMAAGEYKTPDKGLVVPAGTMLIGPGYFDWGYPKPASAGRIGADEVELRGNFEKLSTMCSSGQMAVLRGTVLLEPGAILCQVNVCGRLILSPGSVVSSCVIESQSTVPYPLSSELEHALCRDAVPFAAAVARDICSSPLIDDKVMESLKQKPALAGLLRRDKAPSDPAWCSLYPALVFRAGDACSVVEHSIIRHSQKYASSRPPGMVLAEPGSQGVLRSCWIAGSDDFAQDPGVEVGELSTYSIGREKVMKELSALALEELACLAEEELASWRSGRQRVVATPSLSEIGSRCGASLANGSPPRDGAPTISRTKSLSDPSFLAYSDGLSLEKFQQHYNMLLASYTPAMTTMEQLEAFVHDQRRRGAGKYTDELSTNSSRRTDASSLSASRAAPEMNGVAIKQVSDEGLSDSEDSLPARPLSGASRATDRAFRPTSAPAPASRRVRSDRALERSMLNKINNELHYMLTRLPLAGSSESTLMELMKLLSPRSQVGSSKRGRKPDGPKGMVAQGCSRLLSYDSRKFYSHNLLVKSALVCVAGPADLTVKDCILTDGHCGIYCTDPGTGYGAVGAANTGGRSPKRTGRVVIEESKISSCQIGVCISQEWLARITQQISSWLKEMFAFLQEAEPARHDNTVVAEPPGEAGEGGSQEGADVPTPRSTAQVADPWKEIPKLRAGTAMQEVVLNRTALTQTSLAVAAMHVRGLVEVRHCKMEDYRHLGLISWKGDLDSGLRVQDCQFRASKGPGLVLVSPDNCSEAGCDAVVGNRIETLGTDAVVLQGMPLARNYLRLRLHNMIPQSLYGLHGLIRIYPE